MLAMVPREWRCGSLRLDSKTTRRPLTVQQLRSDTSHGTIIASRPFLHRNAISGVRPLVILTTVTRSCSGGGDRTIAESVLSKDARIIRRSERTNIESGPSSRLVSDVPVAARCDRNRTCQFKSKVEVWNGLSRPGCYIGSGPCWNVAVFLDATRQTNPHRRTPDYHSITCW